MVPLSHFSLTSAFGSIFYGREMGVVEDREPFLSLKPCQQSRGPVCVGSYHDGGRPANFQELFDTAARTGVGLASFAHGYVGLSKDVGYIVGRLAWVEDDEKVNAVHREFDAGEYKEIAALGGVLDWGDTVSRIVVGDGNCVDALFLQSPHPAVPIWIVTIAPEVVGRWTVGVKIHSPPARSRPVPGLRHWAVSDQSSSRGGGIPHRAGQIA